MKRGKKSLIPHRGEKSWPLRLTSHPLLSGPHTAPHDLPWSDAPVTDQVDLLPSFSSAPYPCLSNLWHVAHSSPSKS